MQFDTPIYNNRDMRIQRNNTIPQSDELNAFLLAQATQFVNQNVVNIKAIQPVQPEVRLQSYQRQHIHHNLNIQPYYSDQAINNHAKHNPIVLNDRFDSDEDLDYYLTQKAEELIQNTLRMQLGVQNIQYILPTVKYNDANKQHHKTQNRFIKPVQQFQQAQQVQQLNQFKPLQQVQQMQYYIPQIQVQQQIQAQPIMKPQVQIIEYGTPYILETNEPINISPPQVELDPIAVIPSPVFQREVVNSSPARQRPQAEVPKANSQSAAQPNMQFIQKGPKGEVLYKLTEGGKNYYIKRGLTEEAVNNYNLAYLIGVGPKVDIIGNDGVKMEEGVNLRHAVRDKMITLDEVKNQIQGLHKTLFDTGMAHCDVKFENCLYFPQYKKVLLIDNGDLAIYGNRRKIKTPGANSTLLIHGNEERHRVGPATDLRGFLHIMKNTTDEDINAV